MESHGGLMAKIYKNADELISENKSIFDFLLKSGKRGIIRAIWESRGPEIDELKKEIKQLKKQNKQTKQEKLEFAKDIDLLTKTVESLKQDVLSAKDAHQFAEEKVLKRNEKVEGLEDQIEHLNLRVIEQRIEIKRLIEEFEKEKKRGDVLDETWENEKEEFEKSKEYVIKLQSYVDKANDYAARSEEEAQESKTALASTTERWEEARREKANLIDMLEDSDKKFTQVETDFNEVRQRLLEQEELLSFEREKGRKLDTEISNLNREIEKNNSLIDKHIADVTQSRAKADKFEITLSKKLSELKEKDIYLKELKDFTFELKEDAQKSREANQVLMRNEEKLKNYAEQIKVYLDRSRKDGNTNFEYGRSMERELSQSRLSEQKMREEIQELQKVIQGARESLLSQDKLKGDFGPSQMN